ncbi:MAG: outer membrane protein assembly factor BamC, partial [Pseudomonadales bacterium]
PEQIGTQPIEDAYPIPALTYSKVLPDSFEVPRVEPLDEVEGRGSVRIQRFEGDEWILVQRAPSQTWPLLMRFLASNQIALARSDAQAGLIETELLSDASGKLESYRFALGAGVQKNSTEVRVQHFYRERDPGQPGTALSDDARRKNMLTLFAEQLANSPDRSSHSLLAQGLGTASKVQLRYADDGNPFLLLELPYDRGWASLGLALKKASFEVRDLDRNAGQYFAEYIDKAKREKKPGMLKRLFSRKPEGDTEASDAPLTVRAQESGEGVKITLQRRELPLLRPNEQAFLLRKILQKLS